MRGTDLLQIAAQERHAATQIIVLDLQRVDHSGPELVQLLVVGGSVMPPSLLPADDDAATFPDPRNSRPPVSVRSEVLLGGEGTVTRAGVHRNG